LILLRPQGLALRVPLSAVGSPSARHCYAFNRFPGKELPFFRAVGFFQALLQRVEKVKRLFSHATECGHGEYAE